MTRRMELGDFIEDMDAEWRLDQAFGLTLFDDPWKSLGQTEPVKYGSVTPDVVEHVLQDSLEDSFSQKWMEDTGLEKLFNSITSEPVPNLQLNTTDSADSDKDAIDLLQEILDTTETFSSHLTESVSLTAEPVDIGPVISLDTFQNVGEFSEILLRDDYGMLGSPLSVEDVETLLSSSEPSSPDISVPPSPATKHVSDLEKLLTTNTPISVSQVKNASSRATKSKIKTVSDTCDIKIEFLSKKEKKKIQNKNAAIRYRMKKKVESETIKNEEKDLEDRNNTLKDEVDKLQREIKYIKDLMNEVYNAKKGVKT